MAQQPFTTQNQTQTLAQAGDWSRTIPAVWPQETTEFSHSFRMTKHRAETAVEMRAEPRTKGKECETRERESKKYRENKKKDDNSRPCRRCLADGIEIN